MSTFPPNPGPSVCPTPPTLDPAGVVPPTKPLGGWGSVSYVLLNFRESQIENYSDRELLELSRTYFDLQENHGGHWAGPAGGRPQHGRRRGGGRGSVRPRPPALPARRRHAADV